MSRTATRLVLLAVACALGTTFLLWIVGLRTSDLPTDTTLRASTRSEPVTFNRLLARDQTSLVVSTLINASLVRINHDTQELEPYLAASWTASGDGRHVTLRLHPDARFSDGEPVTADDVRFSFDAVYDTRVGSDLRESLLVEGRPIGVRAVDTHTVELEFPALYGPGLRPLHVLPILPRHLLGAALAAGTLQTTWSLSARPDEVVGAGPFVLERYDPGVATYFRRSPHAWGRAAESGRGTPVQAVELRVLPSQDAEFLQLASGQLDVTTGDLRPGDVPEARRLAEDGVLQVFDLGVALTADLLWFNLVPDAAVTQDRPWLRERAFREAIAYAVDRQAFVDAVYQGSGEPVSGLITSGNRTWNAPDLKPRPHSRDRAMALLDDLGLSDHDGDGIREDAASHPARFSVLVQQGHASRQRAMTVLQETLRDIGLQMDIVSLDAGALFGRYGAGTYEAIYHALPGTDSDPVGLGEFWLSSGSLHLWHPGQSAPATAWEAEIDRLFAAQLSAVDVADRQRSVFEMQRIFDRELPALFFAAPKVHVATSQRLTGVRPGLLSPQVLWNAGEIGVR